MAIIKPKPATVKLFGYLAIALALIDGIAFWLKVFSGNWQPSTPGLHLALSALALTGVIAVIVAECLRTLEARVARIEQALSSGHVESTTTPRQTS
jgi:hypothetical protein